MHTFLSGLDWRFSPHAFDADKKVPAEDLAAILDAAQKAPTAFGLQPFRIISVSDLKVREAVKQSSFGKAEIVDASHLLVFAARSDLLERLEHLLSISSEGDEEARRALIDYEQAVTSYLAPLSEHERMDWAARQLYLALGFAVAAATELRLDTAIVEQMNREDVRDLLGLPSHMLPYAHLLIGYRREEPLGEKKGFSKDDLVSEK